MSAHAVKERDLAGMAAFELALQYALVRQDRSFHFVQLLTAVFSLVFLTQIFLVGTLSLIAPLVPYDLVGRCGRLRLLSSPYVFLPTLVMLLLIRASKKRFIIEPGDQMIERLNRDVLEPCLGLKFNIENGKLYTDCRAADGTRTSGTYYTLCYDCEGTATSQTT